jgi:YegS/Rv2252/BmrU family lipid kinase
MQRAGLAFDIAVTTGRGHAIELAHQARMDGFAVVAAAGGDGTVNEVVNGLARATPASDPVGKLALLPLGSGNDFADMVGCPRDPDQAAAIIAAGFVRQLDIGCASISTVVPGTSVGLDSATQNGATPESTLVRYFGNNMGVGLEAQVTLESYKISRLQGTALYVAAALRTLRNYRSPHMEIRCHGEDGTLWQRTEPTVLVTIGNSRRTGGGFYLTPDALMDDGLFDVGIAANMSTVRLLTLLPRALMGRHTGDPSITMLRSRRIQIACPEGLPVQLDGEVIAEQAGEIDVVIQPGRLQLLSPQL